MADMTNGWRLDGADAVRRSSELLSLAILSSLAPSPVPFFAAQPPRPR